MSSVSRETEALLSRYAELVAKWNSHINLIAPSTVAEIHERHIRDCAQVADIMDNPRGKWLDVGSGGGFPGLVIAILWREGNLTVTMVESDRRKATFLRTVIRELGLEHASVVAERIETLKPQAADILSARALAPLPTLLNHAVRHLRPGGQALFMKGRSWRAEIDQARQNWRFSLDPIPSITDAEAAILRISEVAHAG